MIAMSCQGGYESCSREASLGGEFLPLGVLKDICIGGVPVKVEDHRRLLYPLGHHEPQVNGIVPPPLHSDQRHAVSGFLIDKADHRPNRMEMGFGESRRCPILHDIVE